MSDVVERLVRYCKVSSPSDEDGLPHTPSSSCQWDMASLVRDELMELGAEDVSLDEHAYVTAHWPASTGCDDLPTLGFCCHLDTVRLTCNEPVRPQVVRYEGGRQLVGHDADDNEVWLDPGQTSGLAELAGSELICTDGRTLLGGDDKAGMAELMALLARLRGDPTIAHPRLALAFVPDEEIGHGAALLDLGRFGADYGYTIDAGPLGEFCCETFNASKVTVQARGVSVHTGTAKGMMINAADALMRFHAMLPAAERPEFTQGYDGFYHLCQVSGDVEHARADYILRDHDRRTLERREESMRSAAALMNLQMGSDVLLVGVEEQYRNLAEVVRQDRYAHLIDNARAAYAAVGVQMRSVPMRGGTDGSQLSFRGFPCANLSACYYNAHGVSEFVPVRELEAMVDVLQELVGLYAQGQGKK